MSSLATDTGENHSAEPCDYDVIRSDWVRPIGLRQLTEKNIGVGFTWKKLENYFHSEKASKKTKQCQVKA